MALKRYQETFGSVLADGDIFVLAGASVEVRDETSGALAAIFEDRDGNTAKANPFAADSNGHGFFYAADGRYRITATQSGETVDVRDFIIGFEGISEATITTSTGEQTLAVALDDRVNESGGDVTDTIITTTTGEGQVLSAALEDRVAIAPSTIEVTVGAGGDYETVTEAVEDLDREYHYFLPTNNTATIRLLSGFVWEEQLIIQRKNLSYIFITSDDAEVVISRSALTSSVSVDGVADRFPAICGTVFATLPIIDVLFDMDDSGAPEFHTGILVNRGSSVFVRPGAGVKNSTFEGISAFNNSSVQTVGGIYTGSGTQADSPNSGAGVTSWNNSKVNADLSDASNSYYGFRATVASTLSFRNATANSCTRHNARADEGSVISGFGATLQSAGAHGINCWRGSIAFVEECDVRLAAESGLRAWNGSTIVARGASAFNCTEYGASAFDGGIIDLSASSGGLNSNCNGAGISGLLAARGSRIYGSNVSATGCPTGAYASGGGEILCPGLNVNNSTDIGIRVIDGGKVVATGGSGTGVTNDALFAVDGGYILADDGDFSGAGGRGAVASSSDIYIRGTNVRKGAGDDPDDIVVLNGAIIRALLATGGVSTTANAITSAGIIFK